MPELSPCFWLDELSILIIGMSQPIAKYKNHRFPPEIIARAVWLYYRFPLSLRHVEEMLVERRVAVSYETIRRGDRKHCPDYVRRIRRKPPSSSDAWHLDEVAVRMDSKRSWLLRAVDKLVVFLTRSCRTTATPRLPTFADAPAKEAGYVAEADDHGQVALIRCGKASDHSRR